jgi:peptidoglycan/LPS O-acetylase OafA/YrhL
MSQPIDRQNNFNILRLIFALMVVMSHSVQGTDGNLRRDLVRRFFGVMDLGAIAVDCFFIASGYLIVQSWQRSPDMGEFLQKRIRRIFPGFLAASLFCAFIVGPLGALDMGDYFQAFDFTNFAVGAFSLQRPVIPPVFVGVGLHQVNGSMWTIFPEFVCYMAVLVFGRLGAIANRRYWLALTIVFVGVYAIQRIGFAAPTSTFRFATCFTVGGCHYLYRNSIRLDWKTAAAAAAILFVCMFSWRLSEMAIVLAAPFVLFYLAFKPIPAIAGFNKLPDLSYGVYLYSFPIQALILWYVPSISPWVLMPVSALASLIAGTMSWYAVEQPFLRTRPAALRAPYPPDPRRATLSAPAPP